MVPTLLVVATVVLGGGVALFMAHDSSSAGEAEPTPTVGNPEATKAEMSAECLRWVQGELADASAGMDYDSGWGSCGRLPKEQFGALVTEEARKAMTDLGVLPKTKATEAERFRGCIDQFGTGSEKAAVKHVTKVEGAIGPSRLADVANVYTDYSGEQGTEGLTVATAFTTCYKSIDGKVWIFDKDGEQLAEKGY